MDKKRLYIVKGIGSCHKHLVLLLDVHFKQHQGQEATLS